MTPSMIMKMGTHNSKITMITMDRALRVTINGCQEVISHRPVLPLEQEGRASTAADLTRAHQT